MATTKYPNYASSSSGPPKITHFKNRSMFFFQDHGQLYLQAEPWSVIYELVEVTDETRADNLEVIAQLQRMGERK